MLAKFVFGFYAYEGMAAKRRRRGAAERACRCWGSRGVRAGRADYSSSRELMEVQHCSQFFKDCVHQLVDLLLHVDELGSRRSEFLLRFIKFGTRVAKRALH